MFFLQQIKKKITLKKQKKNYYFKIILIIFKFKALIYKHTKFSWQMAMPVHKIKQTNSSLSSAYKRFRIHIRK